MDKFISQFITKSGKIVSFRYPTIDDAEILNDYVNKLSAEKTFFIFQGEKQTLKEEKQWLKEKINQINKKKCAFILGFINEELVASSEIELNSLARKHIGSFGLTVDQNFRSEGIGKEIMKLVIQEAIKNIDGLRIIELDVFADNPIALSLYKKMGFIKYGRLPDGVIHKDKFVDTILMYKKLK